MSTSVPEQLSQREQAYRGLRRLLLLEQLAAGERLREPVWADRLNVNRAALREAFARLEAEGFLERGAKTGYFVPDLTNEDLHDVIEVRLMLENGAIERLVRLGWNTPRHLKPMREACNQLERLVRESYLLGVAEADRRFHQALVETAGNQRLALLYQRAPLPIIHPVILTGNQWSAWVQQTLEEHRAILAAIIDEEISQAQELLRIHLNERAFIPLFAG